MDLYRQIRVDPLRMYLMSGPLMKGEDANFSEKTVAEIANKIIGRLGNVLSFYELYRDTTLEQKAFSNPTNVLDVWIMSRLNQLVSEVTEGMEAYDMAEATRPFDLFVDDLSTWYLRRSRDRMKDNETEAKQTLYTVLKTVATVLAPFAPFTAEDMWLRLKNETDVESVHLANWPTEKLSGMLIDGEPVPERLLNTELLGDMKFIRNIVEVGHRHRQKLKMPVRQPLSDFVFLAPISNGLNMNAYYKIIAEELNIKNVSQELDSKKIHEFGLNPDWIIEDEFSFSTALNHKITPELKLEGNYRELVRAVQDLRKKEGFTPSDKITASLSKDAEALVNPFLEEFKKTVQAESVSFDLTEGNEISIDDMKVLVKVVKL
jgi:isoleucyl-tRNA synthetase